MHLNQDDPIISDLNSDIQDLFYQTRGDIYTITSTYLSQDLTLTPSRDVFSFKITDLNINSSISHSPTILEDSGYFFFLFLTKVVVNVTFEDVAPCVFYELIEEGDPDNVFDYYVSGPTINNTYLRNNTVDRMCMAANATHYYTAGTLMPVRNLTKMKFNVILLPQDPYPTLTPIVKKDSRLMIAKVVSVSLDHYG